VRVALKRRSDALEGAARVVAEHRDRYALAVHDGNFVDAIAAAKAWKAAVKTAPLDEDHARAASALLRLQGEANLTDAEASRRAKRAKLETDLGPLRDTIDRALDPHKRLDRLVIVEGEWTVANRLLTPTMKLKRSAIEDKYASRSRPRLRLASP